MLNPLAIIRPQRTRGPWVVCTSDGGTILFESRSWARCVEISRNLIDAMTWDHAIDGQVATC